MTWLLLVAADKEEGEGPAAKAVRDLERLARRLGIPTHDRAWAVEAMIQVGVMPQHCAGRL